MAEPMPARIEQRSGHAMWACPNCARTLGEVIGPRLVIIVKRERILNFPLRDDLEMSCPKCGAVSRYEEPLPEVA